MSTQLSINDIIPFLANKNIIPAEVEIKSMKGTTDGSVFVLSIKQNPTYVVKMDHPENIAETVHFLTAYKDIKLFPTLLYCDPDSRFMVYSFLKGTTHFNRGPKTHWMNILVEELFNHYQEDHGTPYWGRASYPKPSWHAFNKASIEGARDTLKSLLSVDDHSLVGTLVEDLSLFEAEEKKYYLHGDTGVHNFTFSDSEITGVIDPYPMVGPILYDFTYAFCSSGDDLNMETLLAGFSKLTSVSMDESRLIKEVVVQLYTRIAICSRLHPHDLQAYLIAWEYWKQKVSTIA